MNTVTRPSHYRVRPREALSPRQTEVLGLVARGYTNARIADELGIGYESVKTHISEILARLEVSSREEAVELWRQQHTFGARLKRAFAPFVMLWSFKAAGVATAVVGFAAAGLIVAALARGGGTDEADSLAPDDATPKPTTAAGATATTSPVASQLAKWKRATDITVAADPLYVAPGFGSVWVTSWSGSVSRIDPATNTVTATIPLASGAGHIREGTRGMWVSSGSQGVIWLIDPQTNSAREVVRLPQRPSTDRPCWMDVLELDGVIWTADPVNNRLLTFDSTTFAARGAYPMPHALAQCPLATFSYAAGFLWVYHYGFEGTLQVDPQTGAVVREWAGMTVPLDTGGELWFGGNTKFALLDASASNTGRSFPAQFEASRIAAGDGLIWATIPNGTGVVVYDTATGESLRISTGRGSEGVTFAFGSAWVTNKDENTVTRVSASP